MLIFLFVGIPEPVMYVITIFYIIMLAMDLYSTFRKPDMKHKESNAIMRYLNVKISIHITIPIMILIETSIMLSFAVFFSYFVTLSFAPSGIIYWLGALMIYVGMIHAICWRSNEAFRKNHTIIIFTRDLRLEI